MQNVKLVWITPDAEQIIGYCARVSNPANQDNPDVAGLLRYCAPAQTLIDHHQQLRAAAMEDL